MEGEAAETDATLVADPTASDEGEVESSRVVEIGNQDGETAPVVLRPLRTRDDYLQCERLERETWGQNFGECVPASILMISQKVGGVAAGAFDSAGRMIGMVFGLTGPRRGELVHWSHMLAVAAEYQGLGLGRELKLYQRRVVKHRGVARMLWTYDPLVARNAYLNICRLGARPVEYRRDLYGADTTSELHAGLGTDRFVVEWRLESAGGPSPAELTPVSSAPVLNMAPDGSPREDPLETGGKVHVRIEIPADIQTEKSADVALGALWRRSTRHAFEACLNNGYSVQGFDRDPTTGQCWYLLRREDSG